MTESQPGASKGAFADAAYTEAVIDLLGTIAYGELAAFERLAEDAKLAPGLADKVALSSMAAGEFSHMADLLDRIEELGADPYEAMEPFRAALDEFHAHTAPSDWYEGLVKAFVGDGLARDFYREIAAYLDPETRALITDALDDTQRSAFVVDKVRAAVVADHRLGGRLALWGRRLMGEALIQAQRVAAERDAMAALLTGGVDRPGLDLAAIGRMLTRLTERHTERMSELGFEA